MPSRRTRRAALLTSLLALALAAGASADYRQSFRKGIEALDLQDWAGAARYMQQAVAEQPHEGERVRIVNVRFEVYLPTYYLGLALYHQGDCAGALRAWEASEAQGAVRNAADEYAVMKGLREECRRKAGPERAPASPTAAPQLPAEDLRRAQAGLARAAEAEAAVASLRRDPAYAAIWLERPALGGRADAAIGKVATANGWIEAARAQGDAAQLGRAAALVTEANGELEAVRHEVEARRDELSQAQARPTPTIPLAVPTVKPPAATGGVPTAAPPAAATPERVALDRQVGRPTAPARQAAPPQLRAAAEAFLAAEYGRAVQLLASAEFADPHAGAVALMLRSASRYSLYLAGGRRDQALLLASAGDARACRRMAPSLAPDSAFFSPTFAEFFRTAR